MKNIFLGVLLIIVLPGCSFFSKNHPRMSETWPVYTVPAQPKLDVPDTVKPGQSKEMDAMISNLYKTTTYIETLRIIVDNHNAAAKAHNARVEAELGIGQ